MRRCRRVHPTLVDPVEVAMAGIPVAEPGPGERRIVLHRGRDGRFALVQSTGLADLPPGLREQAVAMAASVLGGLDVTGRSVTCLRLDGQLSWVSLWRGRNGCGAAAQRRGGKRC